MSENYKFRGKDKNGNWKYGNLMTLIYRGGFVTSIQEEILDEDVPINDSLNTYIIFDSDTIGQFTGLSDKNKVEIYKGDIVRVSEEYGGSSYISLVVDFKDGCFVLRPINNIVAYNPIFEYDFTQIYEVIGNKYDNPELMEF